MEYLELIDSYKEQMINDISHLVRIDSVLAEPVNDKEKGLLPFGAGVQEAFEYVLDRASGDGFITKNVDNYGGHIEFGGYTHDENGDEVLTPEADEIFGIIGHLDVVPVGGGWKTGGGDPFSGMVADGRIYGRGSQDDKGPTMAAYYAMKAVREAGIIPKHRVRLIIGLDEETSWKGVDYYVAREEMPTFGFTPDADFPVIHGEKGMMVFKLAKKFGRTASKGLELRSFKAGEAPNKVIDFARCVVRNEQAGAYDVIKEKVAAFRERTGVHLNCKGTGKSLELSVTGKAAHGSMPWLGDNAASGLFEFLGELDFVNDDVNDFIQFVNTYIAREFDGKSLGCALSDEESGQLVLNLGMVEMGPDAGSLTINVRYPVTFTDADVFGGMKELLEKYNFGIVKSKHHGPLYIPADEPLISNLMDIYREFSGDSESQPLVIGGGTYAKAFPGTVAFGPLFPGDEELAHQPDEFVDIEKLVLAAKMYAEAIVRLAC